MTNIIIFYADYTASGLAVAPSSAPTITVYKINRSTGVETLVVQNAATTASQMVGRYVYSLTGDLQIYDYHSRTHTADTSVDAQDVSSIWPRYTEAVATDSTGGVNLTQVGGQVATLAGAGLIGTGTVTAVTGPGAFSVAFDVAYDGNQSTLTDGTLYLSFSSGLNHWKSSRITGGTLSSTTAAALTFATPFAAAVQSGNTFAIISN